MFSDDCFEVRVHGSIISSILPATCTSTVKCGTKTKSKYKEYSHGVRNGPMAKG